MLCVALFSLSLCVHICIPSIKSGDSGAIDYDVLRDVDVKCAREQMTRTVWTPSHVFLMCS
jgi:hypothetical protein